MKEDEVGTLCSTHGTAFIKFPKNDEHIKTHHKTLSLL